ncbi:co-chaperone GroES [Candidatus Margulisiibacteriota bacterium]
MAKAKTNITPVLDKVLVRRKESEEKTTGGILIPDTAKEKPQQAEVIAVGPGRLNEKGERIPMEINAGDTIIITKWGGTEIKLEGEEYLIIDSGDVLAVLK